MHTRLGLTIVTRNAGEFRNTGVEVVDPWADGQLPTKESKNRQVGISDQQKEGQG